MYRFFESWKGGRKEWNIISVAICNRCHSFGKRFSNAWMQNKLQNFGVCRWKIPALLSRVTVTVTLSHAKFHMQHKLHDCCDRFLPPNVAGATHEKRFLEIPIMSRRQAPKAINAYGRQLINWPLPPKALQLRDYRALSLFVRVPFANNWGSFVVGNKDNSYQQWQDDGIPLPSVRGKATVLIPRPEARAAAEPAAGNISSWWSECVYLRCCTTISICKKKFQLFKRA